MKLQLHVGDGLGFGDHEPPFAHVQVKGPELAAVFKSLHM